MDANFLARAAVRAENERLGSELIELAGHLNAGEHRFLVLLAEFDRRQGWGDGATHSLVHWQQASRGVEFYHDDDGSLVLKARLPAEVGALVLKAFEVAREVQRQEHVPACMDSSSFARGLTSGGRFDCSRVSGLCVVPRARDHDGLFAR